MKGGKKRGNTREQNIVYLFSVILVSLAFFVLCSSYVIALPIGANVSDLNTTTGPYHYPDDHSAHAGNVTELNVFGYSTTRAWQGYFGNVTGVIQLADSSDHIMYNWTSANPRGEVYASRNQSINWNYIECFNFTADGTYADDTPQAGNNSLHGTNYTTLEAMYNITSGDDADSVNNTFAYNNHPLFYTNNLDFTAGECNSTRLYNSTGQGQFDEVLMYEPTGRSVIFNSIINRDADGFDGRTHDFEMLVLEDGHQTDTSPTTYYFYVELGA